SGLVARLSLSGDTLVVGTRPAQVFVRKDGIWTEQATLAADDRTTLFDDVSVSGDTIIAGGSAAAYVFTRSGTSWTPQKALAPSGNNGGFPRSVSISGDRAVVGEPDDLYGGYDPGYAEVFVRSHGRWTSEAQLPPGAADMFQSVVVSGDTVALAGEKGQVDE